MSKSHKTMKVWKKWLLEPQSEDSNTQKVDLINNEAPEIMQREDKEKFHNKSPTHKGEIQSSKWDEGKNLQRDQEVGQSHRISLPENLLSQKISILRETTLIGKFWEPSLQISKISP